MRKHTRVPQQQPTTIRQSTYTRYLGDEDFPDTVNIESLLNDYTRQLYHTHACQVLTDMSTDNREQVLEDGRNIRDVLKDQLNDPTKCQTLHVRLQRIMLKYLLINIDDKYYFNQAKFAMAWAYMNRAVYETALDLYRKIRESHKLSYVD